MDFEENASECVSLFFGPVRGYYQQKKRHKQKLGGIQST